MKNFLLLLLAALCLACQPDPDLHLTKNRTAAGAGTRGRHGDPSPQSPALPDTLVWVSAVEFPETYDWQRDTAYGAVPFEVSVFLEGERILTLPGGPEWEISPDPDMMRIRGGHLYTDYSTDTETVIRRDGEELFRYPGRESLRGFLLRDGRVHTLGQNRSGEGFSYRIDGESILEKDEGWIVGAEDHPAFEGGALFLWGDRVCFSYFREASKGLETYFVADGKVERSDPCPGASWVHDQRLIDGVLYRLDKRTAAQKDPTLVVDGKEVPTAPWYRGDSRKCLIYPDLNGVMAIGFSHMKEADVPYYWKEGFGFPVVKRTDVSHLFYRDGVLSYLCPEQAVAGERVIPFPEPLRLLSPRCAQLFGDGLYLALSGSRAPYLYDGQMQELPVHGFLTGIRVEVPEKDVSLSP